MISARKSIKQPLDYRPTKKQNMWTREVGQFVPSVGKPFSSEGNLKTHMDWHLGHEMLAKSKWQPKGMSPKRGQGKSPKRGKRVQWKQIFWVCSYNLSKSKWLKKCHSLWKFAMPYLSHGNFTIGCSIFLTTWT